MKLCETVNEVEKTGGLTTKKFRIATTRKAFEILSSGLYSDKIKAIIRELSTNAADSHRDAKQTRPFEVHLPNGMEPWFSVRDYGTGLSPKALEDTYTTYFESTRNNSDEFTGCLGLGSKSPFSYIDQFTVESRHDGLKYIYTCFLDEDGSPSVTCMPLGDVVGTTSDGNAIYATPTDEPNGLEVKLSVEAKDFGTFSDRAQSVYKRFNPRPIVTGAAIRLDDVEYIEKTEDFGLPSTMTSKSYVVMGNVEYPISSNSLQGISNLGWELLRYGLDLFASIGDVEMAASRESLQYNKKTIEWIKSTVNSAVHYVQSRVDHYLKAANTLWEARCLLHKLRKTVLSKFIGNTGKWQGQDISDVIRLNACSEEYDVVIVTVGRKRSDNLTWNIGHADTRSIEADGTPIFINDLAGPGAYSRVGHYIGTAGIRKAFLITRRGSWDGCRYVTADTRDPDKRPSLMTTGVQEAAIKVSTLDKPPMATRGTRAATGRAFTKKLLRWKQKKMHEIPGSGLSTKVWEDATVDAKAGGVYVVCAHGKLVPHTGLFKEGQWPVDGLCPDQLTDIYYSLKLLNEAPTDIVGIRPADEEWLSEKWAGKWIHLCKYIETVLFKHKAVMLPRLGEVEAWLELSDSNVLKFDPTCFAARSPFRKFLVAANSGFDAACDKAVIAYQFLRKRANLIEKLPVKVPGLLLQQQELWKKYPLLQHIELSSMDNKSVSLVSDYIMACERKVLRHAGTETAPAAQAS